jgi:hypothetical protein
VSAAEEQPALRLDSQTSHGLVDDLIYEHLLDLVDWSRVRTLEEILSEYFVDALDDTANKEEISRVQTLARDMIEAAWQRLLADERRFMERATAFSDDDDCVICRELAARNASSQPPRPSVDDRGRR